jgi:hypothetical protein
VLLGEPVVQILGDIGRWKQKIDHGEEDHGPGEEGEIRPDIKHLGEMQASSVKLFVAWFRVSIPLPTIVEHRLPRTTPLFHRTNAPKAPRIARWGIIEATREKGCLRLAAAKDTAVLK